MRVSVLLPVRDGDPHLAEALSSLSRQTEADFEVVAVDDGSTDGTPLMLRTAARRDPRLRIVSPGRVGLVSALGIGLEAARGRYVARMDADDVCHAKRLETQADFLDRHADIGLVASRVRYLGDRRANLGLALWVDWTSSLLTPEQIDLHRFVESPFVHPSVMFRRELVARHGGYRAGPFPEDYELWLRWLEAGVRMAKLPRELLDWRERPGRLTRTDPRYAVDAFYGVKAPYLARRLARAAPREIAVWGAGRTTRKRLRPLREEGVEVAAYIDIDPDKIGQRIDGVPVLGPDDLPDPGRLFVLQYVGSRGARELIRDRLEARAYRIGRDWLPCA